VLEGRVAVVAAGAGRTHSDTPSAVVESRSSGSRAQPVELAAGEQVTVAPNAVERPTVADVTAATAWRQRELVFNATSLIQVAEEFNRYNTRRLTIANAQLADFHVTGVFSSTDATSLLRFLRLQPGIRVQEFPDEIRISTE
jgi:transmembrane sensor